MNPVIVLTTVIVLRRVMPVTLILLIGKFTSFTDLHGFPRTRKLIVFKKFLTNDRSANYTSV